MKITGTCKFCMSPYVFFAYADYYIRNQAKIPRFSECLFLKAESGMLKV